MPLILVMLHSYVHLHLGRVYHNPPLGVLLSLDVSNITSPIPKPVPVRGIIEV